MKRFRSLVLALFLGLTMTQVLVSREARAQETDEGTLVVSGTSSQDLDRWWGAGGAVLCGLEIRLLRVAPEIGFNPYVLAAGIGGCLLAVLDCATT
ncbi:MAG: hypothetical protein E6K80_05400 [Candidatus Eisenbacteria bacterium]|uniref:Uncharacterized protein n=1 Tax=Eiseniibacteriota bacterium TaxID=2212470 RepID=A0A538U6I3_UNCEI|nr:MAG: hypothetical protein E6K80_05400 [Candidatus Eisenbacteria bacterium]